jgi:hypothetical protein
VYLLEGAVPCRYRRVSRPAKDPGSKPRIPWNDLAASLGYDNPDQMLIDMYARTGKVPIAEKLGVSAPMVVRRLRQLGVKIRPPGGVNNKYGRYGEKAA